MGNTSPLLKRLHVYYTGSVQGVGFRYTVERTALALGLTGWVRNLDDGRVEIVCEGLETVIAGLVEKVQDVFRNELCDWDVTWSDATGEFETFDIRF